MHNEPPSEENQGPLSPQQQEDLAQASERAKKILGAAKVAAFNGWTLGLFGAVSVLSGILSPTGFLVGIGLLYLARNEFRGRTLLRQFDDQGPVLLFKNQIGLIGLITVYCLWCMFNTVANPSAEVAQLQELAGLPDDFVANLTLTAYGSVIVLSLLFQGLNARYYHARTKMLESYKRETPDWIVDLQRINLDTQA